MTKNKVQKNIPDEWRKIKLGDLGKVSMCKRVLKHQTNDSGDIPFFKIGTFGKEPDAYITQELFDGYKEKYSFPQKGDILISASGTIGRLVIYDGVSAYFQDSNIIWIANTEKNVKNIFLKYLYKRVKWDTSTGTIARLYNDNVRNIKILAPPLEEQKKIVEVLEVWDFVVEKLERKIVIKENIKKGLMQQLLTGKKRLPGFGGEWEEKRLVEIGEARTSSVDKKSVDGERQISLLNYMDVYKRNHIFQNDIFQQVTAKDTQIISSNLKQGDILFTPSSETPGDIGHSAVAMENLGGILFSYHLMRFRPKNNILNYNFSAYAFKSFNFYKELWRKAQGATRYTLSKNAIEQSKITIPKDLGEQKAIAEVLTTADEEIEMLREKLDILKDQKMFLLNSLVTGQIRVPE